MKTNIFSLLLFLATAAGAEPTDIALPIGVMPASRAADSAYRQRDGDSLVVTVDADDCRKLSVRPSYAGRLRINGQRVLQRLGESACHAGLNVLRVENYFPPALPTVVVN